MSLKYIITGGARLCGSVDISGAKNAALPVMAASLLTGDECKIYNVPFLSDTQNMLELLKYLGADVLKADNNIVIKTNRLNNDITSYEAVSKLRASFLVAGPVLARTGYVNISMPGGCPIGSRPIDLHLKALTALGASITRGHGYIEAECSQLHGAKIYFDFPSVGATETAIMTASLAEGTTIIENAAAEPEIADLALFINSMGGNISGAGTDTVTVTGKKSLHGSSHTVIPDRIEAGTFLTAVAMTGGKARINNVVPCHLKPITAKLRECGIDIEAGADFIDVDAFKKPTATDIKTMPYPGFPTDLQPQITTLLSVAKGTSIVTESVWDNRFQYVDELKRLGAKISVDGRTAVVEGVESLSGCQVVATDLRAGAGMVIAALMAKGVTEIGELRHIDRGYENFEQKLAALGAQIKRIDDGKKDGGNHPIGQAL